MKKGAFFCIVAAGVLWGSSGLFSDWLTPYGFSPVQMTTFRGVVSVLFMVPFILIKNPKLLKVPKKEIKFLIGSGVSLFATAYTYFAAIKASSVSTAVILMYTAPIFVLIYSVLFLGEKLDFLKGMSIFFMIIGCALVSGMVGGMKFSLLGVLFGMASGISYSAYNIFTKILTLHKVNTYTVSNYNFIIMSIVGLLVSNPSQMLSLTVASPDSIVIIISLGLFTCILPYVFYNTGLSTIPAGTATALGIIEPLSATLLSVLFIDEKLTIPLIVGMLLIVMAVIILAKHKTE